MRLRPRRLLWRIYLHSLGGLVVFAALITALVFMHRDDRSPLDDLPERVTTLLPELGNGDGQSLRPTIDTLGELLQTNMALYSRDGTLLVATGPLIPGPLTATDPIVGGEAVGFSRRLRHHVAVPLPGSDRYLLVTWRKPFAGKLLVGLLGVLVFIGIVSIPAARAVARPLDRLTATARALGHGDLDARSGLDRGDEIGELARAMDEMAERLQRLLARERQLLADISHELRTPLARIRVALELQAEEGGLGEFLDGVEDDLAELEGLVADVLTSARLDLTEGEAGFSMRPVPLQLDAVLDASAARFRRRHGDRTLTVALGGALPTVRADEALIRRVIDNLLENAARYSDAPAPIEVRATEVADGLLVEVADRGVGIAEADLPKLFEPFFRADRSRARATGGVGLGLTLCRRIVEAHGGKIEGRPRPGGGAVFRFILPTAADAAGDGGSTTDGSGVGGARRGFC